MNDNIKNTNIKKNDIKKVKNKDIKNDNKTKENNDIKKNDIKKVKNKDISNNTDTKKVKKNKTKENNDIIKKEEKDKERMIKKNDIKKTVKNDDINNNTDTKKMKNNKKKVNNDIKKKVKNSDIKKNNDINNNTDIKKKIKNTNINNNTNNTDINNNAIKKKVKNNDINNININNKIIKCKEIYATDKNIKNILYIKNYKNNNYKNIYITIGRRVLDINNNKYIKISSDINKIEYKNNIIAIVDIIGNIKVYKDNNSIRYIKNNKPIGCISIGNNNSDSSIKSNNKDNNDNNNNKDTNNTNNNNHKVINYLVYTIDNKVIIDNYIDNISYTHKDKIISINTYKNYIISYSIDNRLIVYNKDNKKYIHYNTENIKDKENIIGNGIKIKVIGDNIYFINKNNILYYNINDIINDNNDISNECMTIPNPCNNYKFNNNIDNIFYNNNIYILSNNIIYIMSEELYMIRYISLGINIRDIIIDNNIIYLLSNNSIYSYIDNNVLSGYNIDDNNMLNEYKDNMLKDDVLYKSRFYRKEMIDIEEIDNSYKRYDIIERYLNNYEYRRAYKYYLDNDNTNGDIIIGNSDILIFILKYVYEKRKLKQILVDSSVIDSIFVLFNYYFNRNYSNKDDNKYGDIDREDNNNNDDINGNNDDKYNSINNGGNSDNITDNHSIAMSNNVNDILNIRSAGAKDSYLLSIFIEIFIILLSMHREIIEEKYEEEVNLLRELIDREVSMEEKYIYLDGYISNI